MTLFGVSPALGARLVASALFLTLVFRASTPSAQSNAADAPSGTGEPAALRVGYAGSPPFVLKTEHADGLSIAIWRIVAARAGLSYHLLRRRNVAETIDAVADGDLDVAVGPLSITSKRARKVRFTQPYFNAELGIAAPSEPASAWNRLAPFVGKIFAGASLALMLSLISVGTVVWLLERKKNPAHFPQRPLKGIGNGIWFALVTMTTVGYGDRVPVTLSGRAIAGIWMIVALVTTTSLTAGVASAITVIQLDKISIEKIEDLKKQKVAVVAGTTGEAFAKNVGAVLIPAPDLSSAIAIVNRGGAVAIIHDKPILQYYVAQHPATDLVVARTGYEPQGYGFAITPDRDLFDRINVALLAAQEDGQVDRAVHAWLRQSERGSP